MEIINKKFLKNLAIVVVFFICILALNAKDKTGIIKSVEIGGQKVRVDVADDVASQQQGLSGRASLKEDEGLLFIFSQPGKYGFWMKDMNFPIDIIWISEDLKVVYIKKDARPELFPEQYSPTRNAKYVLEVVSGFSEKNNLEVGDQAEFVY